MAGAMADGNPKRVVSLTMFNWMAATFDAKAPRTPLAWRIKLKQRL